jgi:transcriptional regulator with XRE-family HTH domain
MASVQPGTYAPAMSPQPVGEQIRIWRQRRRLSQLALASEAEISARHLSFVETGRATPSRDMLLHLAEQLEIPPRERNQLLVAAGYAPIFSERPLSDASLAPARAAIDLVLQGHRPYPAFALDRHWNIVASNGALPQMFDGVDAALLRAPINALRISLHPHGLAPRIINLAEWRAHLLRRLGQQIELSADPLLIELLAELRSYPSGSSVFAQRDAAIVVPLQLRIGDKELAFFSTTLVFGTPLDVTLSELAIESFFAADSATAEAVRSLAG